MDVETMIAVEAPTKQEALESRFLSAFEAFAATRENNGANALTELREKGFASFLKSGFPEARSEAWKYTNIRKKLKHEFHVSHNQPNVELDNELLDSFSIDGLDADRLVLINGQLAEPLSNYSSGNVTVSILGDATDEPEISRHLGRYANYNGDSFVALNTAFIEGGICLHVARGKTPSRPVHILNITSGSDQFVQPRLLVVVDKGASINLIETQHGIGTGTIFVNSVVEAFVGADARVDYVRVQDGGETVSAVNNVNFYQEGSSYASCTTLTLSGDTIRNNVVMHPDGEHCESHLYGLFLGDQDLHVDNHTLVDHAKPNCYSNELYKGILDGGSKGVFNGRVLVRRDAQKTNAYQSNKTIVLGDRASMNAKPELEIYADDVKCSHGATTGRLDDEAMFYLRSRGLTADRARRLLLLAFVRDVVESLQLAPLRDHVDSLVQDRMGHGQDPSP
ncbi:MAG: Fe-S cluster assembly protein SufD [Rhodothermales bacterium]|nr:Fe-S cluster assembly protein SufD [Rhodothermales bacterium]